MRAQGHDALLAVRARDELERRARAKDLGLIALEPRTEIDPAAILALRRAIRQYDVHIVHAHTAHTAALVALARVGTRARAVVSRRVILPLRRNPFSRFKYRSASAVIAISRAVAEIVTAGGVPRDRIHVVPDGIALDAVPAPASAETLHSLGVSPAATPLVVQVGALGRDKDPVTFVRAIAAARSRLPSIEALLVGDGPLRDEVAAEIQRGGLAECVRLTGFRHDAGELLAAAHVASLSSVEEGMGSVLLDAMASGVPVAATRVGGIPEVVEHGATGMLSAPRDPGALADNIVRLATDRGLASTIAANGKKRVSEFSVERMTQRTVEVYERVLGA